MLYSGDADVYSQAASNLVSGNNLEQTIQQILDMGGGTWERDTVVRALRAAYNNPERAIDYLYSVSSMLTNYLPMICSVAFFYSVKYSKVVYAILFFFILTP